VKRAASSIPIACLALGLALAARVVAAAPATPQAELAELLQQWIAAGRLPALHWPVFVDYQGYVNQFYAPAAYAPAWIDDHGPTPAALALIDQFQHADLKGLRPDDYDADRWPARLAALRQTQPPPTITQRAEFDLAMTVCLMRFISDLHIGRVNPRAVNFELDVDQKKYDLPVLIRRRFVNAQPGDVPQLISAVEPPFDGYRRLEQAALLYVRIAAQYQGAPLPAPERTVNPGDTYAGVSQLVALLRAVGDLPADTAVATAPGLYQGAIVAAVRSFQERHGLDPDGRLGKGTIAAMNVPLTWRLEQIRLALERWRWLPASFSQPPIVVNIPEFMLRAYGPDGTAELRMRVVVGRAFQHRTPVFTGNLRTVVFRPYWNVPLSIQRAELVPKLAANPGYLASGNYEVVTNDGTVVTDGAVGSAVLARLRAGQLLLRQKPGDKNSLGLVKFLFPNSYNVYMHDTPSVTLFAKSRRDFSHGCIRVADPTSLALWVLRKQPRWDQARIATAMTIGPDNVAVAVAPPIPVLIIYGTARAGRDGKVYFFDDIYGYDRQLENLLAQGYPYP